MNNLHYFLFYRKRKVVKTIFKINLFMLLIASCSQQKMLRRFPASVDLTCSELIGSFFEQKSIRQYVEKKFLDKAVEFDVSKVKIKNLESSTLIDGRIYDAVLVGEGDEELALIQFAKLNGVLRFDIFINEKYRGLGLYYYSLELILKKVRDIKSIPARMEYSQGDMNDNINAFFDTAFSTTKSYKKSSFDITKLKKSELKALYKKILLSYLEMPAIKARKVNGFSKVKGLLIDLEENSLSFSQEKGGFKDFPLFFRLYKKGKRVVYKLSKKGKLKEIEKDDLYIYLNRLPGYINIEEDYSYPLGS